MAKAGRFQGTIKALKNLPIRNKLTLIVTFTCAVSLLLASAGFLTYELISFRRAAVRSMEIQGRMVGMNAAAALSFGDTEAVSEALAGLAADPDVKMAGLYDVNGKLVSRYTQDGYTNVVSFPQYQSHSHDFSGTTLSLSLIHISEPTRPC